MDLVDDIRKLDQKLRLRDLILRVIGGAREGGNREMMTMIISYLRVRCMIVKQAQHKHNTSATQAQHTHMHTDSITCRIDG